MATSPAPPAPSGSGAPPPRPLPYSALRAATANWHPLSVIGEGGFGTVYRGMLPLAADGGALPVAIKRQAAPAAAAASAGATGASAGAAAAATSAPSTTTSHSHQQGAAEFLNEVALLRRLRHPNLVQLVGWCDPFAADGGGGGGATRSNPFAREQHHQAGEQPRRCLVYELCAGGSLDDALRAGGSDTGKGASSSSSCALPWRARLAVAAQAASAIAALHAASVCHGDIKPANLLLLLPDAARAMGAAAAEGGGAGGGGVTAKLADVGLATAAASSPAASRPGQTLQTQNQVVRGDWAYLPPEARSRGTLGPRADAFALGVTLLQLATGAVERVHELPLRARLAAAAGGATGGAGAGATGSGGGGGGGGGGGAGLASLLDPRAGGWDAAAGERLLRVALWLCAEREEERGTVAGAAAALAALSGAGDRATEAGARRERARAEALAQQWARVVV